MKSRNLVQNAVLLALFLGASASVYARGGGADDPATHDATDDKGGSSSSSSSSSNSPQGQIHTKRAKSIVWLADNTDDPAWFAGKQRNIVKRKRTDFRVDVKVRDEAVATEELAAAAVVDALITDAAGNLYNCDLDFNRFNPRNNKVEYSVRLRLKGNKLSENAGTCSAVDASGAILSESVLPTVEVGGTIAVRLEVPDAVDPTLPPTYRVLGTASY
jgi:hypothetical protein